MFCFSFNCPKVIPLQGHYKVVDRFSINIAGWHNGQRMSARIYLNFCTDACALHFLETDVQGEDRPGLVKTEMEVLESVLHAHQRWYGKNGGDGRVWMPNSSDGIEPDYDELDIPRQSEELVVVSRVRVPTIWTAGESYAAIEFGFDSIATRAEFSRRLVTADEKLSFFLRRARQLAGREGA